MIKKTINPYLIFPLIACLFLMGCIKKVEDGKNSLIDQIAEPAGEYCAAGGYKIITGLDENRNNMLDSNEIQKTEYVCNGTYNKETIIPFPGSGYAYGTSTVQNYIENLTRIYDFNISNYQADSVSFSTYLRTQDANVKCTIELYDLTNNKVINNTTLTTNSTTYWGLQKTTVNFLNSFPKTTIDLGIALRSEKEGTLVSYYLPTIKLYKR
jgi:hypothetical protein